MRHLVGTLAILLAFNASAELSSHMQAAYKLLEVSRSEEVLEQSIEQMAELELQNNPTLLPYRKVLREYYAEVLSYESLRDEYAYVYMDHFSEAEIHKLIEFHESPVGQKLMTAQPIILRQTTEMGQERVMSRLDELRARIEDEARRIARDNELGSVE